VSRHRALRRSIREIDLTVGAKHEGRLGQRIERAGSRALELLALLQQPECMQGPTQARPARRGRRERLRIVVVFEGCQQVIDRLESPRESGAIGGPMVRV